MDYCGPKGIPHSEFMEWSPEDRAKAIGWKRYKATVCSRCGTQHKEWDPKQGGDRNAYIPEIHICHGCEKMDLAQEAAQEGDAKMRGVFVRLRPRET